MTEPSRTVEVERKYDVDGETPLPVWEAIPGVDAVTAGEARALDAQYFDTADGDLARAGWRCAVAPAAPDEGWHVEGTAGGRRPARTRLAARRGRRAPRGRGRHRVRLDDRATHPARPHPQRPHRLPAHTVPRGVVAEFVDDRVQATDLRGDVQREWREWEMELGPAAPADDEARAAFFAAVERAVLAAGGRESASGSKLARALGF